MEIIPFESYANKNSSFAAMHFNANNKSENCDK
uniref:Uncharacterized protein n=1 Tax=Rhizophora mucronata TaxID=61149 RepID=A0A2P2N3M4_RHIMU